MSKREISVLNTTARYILVCEFLERLAFYGFSASLLLYFVTYLDYSNEEAFNTIYIWTGFIYITPLVGGYIADTYCNRYDTWMRFSIPYLIGFMMFTIACEPDITSEALVYVSIYLIAIGTGGVKPVIAALGADQFDVLLFPQDAIEYELFFSYFYWAINLGALIAFSIIAYICQYGIEPLGGPDWGFFIGMCLSAFAFAFAIISLMAGYSQYNIKKPQGTMFTTAIYIVYDAIKVTCIHCCSCIMTKSINNRYKIKDRGISSTGDSSLNMRMDSSSLALLHDYNTSSSNDNTTDDKIIADYNTNNYISPDISNVLNSNDDNLNIGGITPNEVHNTHRPRTITGEDIEVETDGMRRSTITIGSAKFINENRVSVIIDDSNSSQYDNLSGSGYSGSNDTNNTNDTGTTPTSENINISTNISANTNANTNTNSSTSASGRAFNNSRTRSNKYSSVDTAAETVVRDLRQEVIPSRQALAFSVDTINTNDSFNSNIYREPTNDGIEVYDSDIDGTPNKNNNTNNNNNDSITYMNTNSNKRSHVDMSVIQNKNIYAQMPQSMTQEQYQLRRQQQYDDNHIVNKNNINIKNNNIDTHSGNEPVLVDDEWETFALPLSWLDNANYDNQYDPSFIESVKYIFRLSPFFCVMIPYWMGYGQTKTAFQAQGCQMENQVGSFEFPLVAMNLFDALTIIACIPLCEKYLYPYVAYIRNNKPLSVLEKIGIGLLLASISMLVAAIIETERLHQSPNTCNFTDEGCLDNISVCRSSYNYDGYEYIKYINGQGAKDEAPLYCHQSCETIDTLTNTLSVNCVVCDDVPQKSSMNILWQAPQFIIIGLSQIFASICSLELFYSEAPRDMRTVSQALYYVTNGLGNWFAIPLTLLVNIDPNNEWITSDVNTGRLDWYFFLLSSLMIATLFYHFLASRTYKYVNQTILQSLSLSCELALKHANKPSFRSSYVEKGSNATKSNISLCDRLYHSEDVNVIRTTERIFSNTSVDVSEGEVGINTLKDRLKSLSCTSVGSRGDVMETRTISITY